MKKNILLISFISLFCSFAKGQYNDEWIDYSKTYYKFSIGATGLYRIKSADLPSALTNVPVQQFQLWRNGKQVAIYTSVESGPLPSDGYIEFEGFQNDGVADSALYKNPSNQLSTVLSLETDTCAYFLKVYSNGSNFRVVDGINDVTNGQTAQPYFTYDYRRDFKQQINLGKALVLSNEYFYSGTYDVGEWWSSMQAASVSDTTPLYIYPGLPANLSVSVANNNASLTGSVTVSLNGQNYITNQPMSPFAAQVFKGTIANLSSANAITKISDPAGGSIVCGFIDLQYARTFDFGGSSNFSFVLPASTSGNYFEVSDFNGGNSVPVLYDLSNNVRYAANTSTAGIYKFSLPASTIDRSLVLASEDAVNNIGIITPRNFSNYAFNPSLQSNYIIISNKALGLTSSGAVGQYAAYRASAKGGGFVPGIYDIDDLIDEFAYGIKKHPLSVKNFMKKAYASWSMKPQFVFIIGKGVVYDQYRYNESSSADDELNLVPAFGNPASDALLTSNDFGPLPPIPFGRLSVVSSQEVQEYLTKIKGYETVQNDTSAASETLASKGWMKKVAHVVGADDANGNLMLQNFFNVATPIIQQPSFGAQVTTFNKLSTLPGNGTSEDLQNLFDSGMSLLNYFGHGSITSLDFNLNDVTLFNNPSKYPVFFINGCNTGNVYLYDSSRLTQVTSISENFVLAQNRGVIATVAGTNLGESTPLSLYINGFYTSLDSAGYNNALGYNMLAATQALLNDALANPVDSLIDYIHAEQQVLNGDPALKINASSRPDFDVEASTIFTSPSFISVSDASFTTKVYFYNLGKAVKDSVPVLIKWQSPDGSTKTIYQGNRNFIFTDSITITVPIIGSIDKGNNNIIASIGYNADTAKFNEITLSNNNAIASFVIDTVALTPVYPYNYAIISKDSGKIYASTANVFAPSMQYVMQMDTTTFFNSPALVTKNITSIGGLIEFDPGIIYSDSVVYYWRTAAMPANGNPYHWNGSSFVYLGGTTDGFNQSHLYQHLNSTGNNIYIDSNSRQWNFAKGINSLTLNNTYFSSQAGHNLDNDFSLEINTIPVATSACIGHSIVFNVLDPNSLKPFYNQQVPSVLLSGPTGGFMGSGYNCNTHVGSAFNFEFYYNTVTGRNQMAAFMNWIPPGYIVTARVVLNAPFDDQTFANDWATDPLVNGTNLYTSLKTAGFTDLDSFYYPRTWVFTYQKNVPAYGAASDYTLNLYDAVSYLKNVNSLDTTGTITSPIFGPANAWKNVQWNGYDEGQIGGDKATVDVIGITSSGLQTVLYNLTTAQQNFDISSVNVGTYPYIQLRMHNTDGVNYTPYQLNWWRLYYTPVPEGALAPNLNNFIFSDTVNLGKPLNISIPFKNISDVDFSDSIKINLVVFDASNNADTFAVKALKPILSGDTAMINISIPTDHLGGINNFYLDVNPLSPSNGLHQPEQFHFNNFFYQLFTVIPDVSLAVSTLSFTAQAGSASVWCKWTVINEANTLSYTIEKSVDGQHFVSIGNLNAYAGNAVYKAYSYNDLKPFVGKNYYRIKSINKNGSATYSEIRTVYFDGKESVNIYPNPTRSQLNISLNNFDNNNINIKLLNAIGQQVMQQSFSGNFSSMDISKLTAGNYILIVNNGKEIKTIKIQKQN